VFTCKSLRAMISVVAELALLYFLVEQARPLQKIFDY
jgi:hypothetical protein